MKKNKILNTAGEVLAGGVGVTCGALAAASIVVLATTATSKIIYGALTYFVVGSISHRATEIVVDPIVQLLKTEDDA